MLKAFVLGVIVALAVFAFVVLILGGVALYVGRMFGALEVPDEAEALSTPSLVALALAPGAPVAARVLLPARDAGFLADDHTADRHTRLAALQQRETPARAPRVM